MTELSYKTIAEQLARVLRSLGAYQLFALELGPGDAVYISALATGPDGNVVEAKSSASSFELALEHLFLNLQQATATEGK